MGVLTIVKDNCRGGFGVPQLYDASQKKYCISWTKRGVAETYCTMYGHGMYDPAKHEEHCWPVGMV